MGKVKDLVDRQHDMLRRRDVRQVAELYTADAQYMLPGVRVSPAELPALMEAYLDAFPDIENEITWWMEKGDTVVIEQVITGTHTGAFVTPFGTLEATGRTVRSEAVEVVHARGHLISSWRSYFDQFEFLTSLGLLAGP